MAMRAFWSHPACDDLLKIEARIRKHDANGAREVIRALLNVVERLARNPGAGKPGRVPDTQELLLGGGAYDLVYRTRGERLDVLRVLHLV
jgi:plasmid stabilization system protein ParE